MGCGVLWVDVDRFKKVLLGFGVAFVAMQKKSEPEMSLVVCRVNFDGFPEMSLGGDQIGVLQKGAVRGKAQPAGDQFSKPIMGACMRGINFDGSFVVPDSLIEFGR